MLGMDLGKCDWSYTQDCLLHATTVQVYSPHIRYFIVSTHIPVLDKQYHHNEWQIVMNDKD